MNNLKNQGVASVKFSMSITLLNLEKLVRFSYKYWRNSGGAPKDLGIMYCTYPSKNNYFSKFKSTPVDLLDLNLTGS